MNSSYSLNPKTKITEISTIDTKKLTTTLKNLIPSTTFDIQHGTYRFCSNYDNNFYGDNFCGPNRFTAALQCQETTQGQGATIKFGYYGISSSEEDIIRFIKFLSDNPQITSVIANNSFINEAAALALATLLKTNTSLKSLDIHYSCINKAGMTAIFDALKTNSSLIYLNIRSNTLDDALLQQLLDVLTNHNSTLMQTLLIKNRQDNEERVNPELLTAIDRQLHLNFNSLLKKRQGGILSYEHLAPSPGTPASSTYSNFFQQLHFNHNLSSSDATEAKEEILPATRIKM
jgi:hypothetical protein